jgi:Na+/phosphate symporter
MKCNVGKIDRLIRTIFSFVLIVWGVTSQNIIMVVVGISLLLTAILGSCIIYSLFNLDTGCKHKDS